MFSNKRKKKDRHYKVKKFGVKDENIDRQILAIHKAIAEKVLANQELAEQVKQKLEHSRKQGKVGYGEYITWLSLLENIDKPEIFISGMLDNSSRMRQLRRRTPFTGILSEQERLTALQFQSLGTVDITAVL